MYGTQATSFVRHYKAWFENDVKMYGTQAGGDILDQNECLRMM